MLTYEQALKNLQDHSNRIATIRAETIEECAREVERGWINADYGPEIAAAIRALKDKP